MLREIAPELVGLRLDRASIQCTWAPLPCTGRPKEPSKSGAPMPGTALAKVGGMAASLLRRRRFAPLFLTQLLGAANDNLLKSALVVTVTVGTVARSGAPVETYVNLATALLILPFFLFSAIAGQLADKVDKARLVRALKVTELLIMGLATIGFHLGSLPLLFASLFLMGTQSAFFGPVKYAILPQHLAPDELVGGNGLVEMGTFVAILVGTLVGGLVIAIPGVGTFLLTGCLLAVALSGWLVSRQIPDAPSSSTSLSLDWNLARSTWRTVAIAKRNRPAFRAILGASWFWFLGALLLAQLPLMATGSIGGDERTITILLAIFSVGIGLGSLACERLTSGRIELGLIVPAAIVMGCLIVDLAFVLAGAPGDGTIPVRVGLDLFGVGFAGGLFIVPLYALMQERSAVEERSRIIAANNIVNAAFMVVSAGFAIAMSAAGFSLSELLLATAVLQGVAVVVCFHLTRDYVLRLLIGTGIRVLYRVRATGVENLPDHGPAIVVANHVTYGDAMFLGAVCSRPIRFVVDHRVHDARGLRWFFRLCRAIPIAPRSEDPARLERALLAIDQALDEGELVGIFPEGQLTRDGNIGDFRSGIERILARRPVPVVPAALRGLWGSFMSYDGGRPLTKWPRWLRRRGRLSSTVELIVGRVLPPDQATADLLQARVEALRGSQP